PGMPNTYFALEASRTGAGQWHEILEWKLDDPTTIPRHRFQFVGERVFYGVGSDKFVVKTDNGDTWSVWDSKRELHNLKHSDIREVRLDADGTGTMVVDHRTNGRSDPVGLMTQDFGKHWALSSPAPPSSPP